MLSLQGDREGGVSMLPPVAAQLPRLHTATILQPPAWRGFAASVSLEHLEDLDLQVGKGERRMESRKGCGRKGRFNAEPPA